MQIRAATTTDHDAVWAILEPVIRAGETWALPRDMSREAALSYWFLPAHWVFVAEDEGEVLGTYFVQPNHMGGGDHVANGGYMTAQAAQGRGVARAMCQHSLAFAREKGFRAMQYNFVVSTNERAVRTWLGQGFEVAGRLPAAFRHPTLGEVDVLVLFQKL